MGINISIKREEQTANIWICLASGCARFEENKDSVYAGIEDRRKDNLRIEKSVTLWKHEGYLDVVHDIMFQPFLRFWWK